ncbi:MAG: HK97 family phage prohead protease [Bacteroidales bacterium]|nr:HK97 family phage prohead protease [Bacteroidales bacterium]
MAKETNRTFVMCDSSKKNTYGFRIDLTGMDMNRFTSNPVMLYRHNSEDLIGRWENIRIEDGKLKADPVFDMEDEVAKKVSGRVERGFMRGCSVGIIIYDLKETGKEIVATKTELLEASICAIPADAGAVVLYDENRKQLTFEEVKLQFNYNNTKKQNMEEKEKKELEQSIAEKDREIAELKASISETKKMAVVAFLDAAVKDGKITEKEKPAFEKLAAADFDSVKNINDSRETKASGSLRELQAQAGSAIPSGRENWTYLEWMKKDSEGLKRMKIENPNEFERLKKTLQ